MSFREELLERWYVADPFRPTEEALRYYEMKHAIVKRLRPESICEIGVRAGYSLYAFLSAAPAAEYLGIDSYPGTDEDVVFEVHAHHIAEEARTAIRQVRRDGNEKLKKMLKAHEISEDDEKRALDEIQKITDKHIDEVGTILKHKEADIMAV